MQAYYKLNESTIAFFKSFKLYLDSTGKSIDQFFVSNNTSDISKISSAQFQHIFSLLNLDAQPKIDKQFVFNQISRQSQSIKVTFFKKLYASVQKKMAIALQNYQSIKEDQLNKKSCKINIYKLLKFMQKLADPIEFLKRFDQHNTGFLNRESIQKMLIATKIPQFTTKTARIMAIQTLFILLYPQRTLSLPKFIDFIQLSCHEKLKRFYRGEEYLFRKSKKPKSQPKIIGKIQKVKRQSLQDKRQLKKQIKTKLRRSQPSFCKKFCQQIKHYQLPQLTHPNNKDQKINLLDVQLSEALKYYHTCYPILRQHEHLQHLQNLLQKQQIFVDIDNPRTNLGTYKTSEQIFQTNDFDIFQMAQSVLVRESDRVGIAQYIEPNDIIQGEIGDCYFLSSIAAIISIYPQIIAQRFMFDKNPAHMYSIKLFVDGQWKIFTTDDSFPCRKNSPIYARPHHEEIWVMLLEKCWAKNFGSYQAIESGSSKEGFTFLTGAPTEVFNKDKGDLKAQTVIQILKRVRKNGCVATVNGSIQLTSLGVQACKELGLIPEHAYSVIKIINIGQETLIQLRNPWGVVVWKGDWSFQSELWTPQLREKYSYTTNQNDGTFYMPWKAFNRYFNELVVCKFNPLFVHSSVRVQTQRNKFIYCKMQIKREGKYIISIYQKSRRKMLATVQNYQYSVCHLIVMKEDNKFVYKSARAVQNTQICNCHFDIIQEGDYILAVRVSWKYWAKSQIVITTYGIDYTILNVLDNDIENRFNRQLVESYSSIMSGSGKIKNYDKYELDATCQSYFNSDVGLGFVKIANKSSRGFQSIQEFNMNGLQIINATLPLNFKMKPNSTRAVGFLVSPSGYQYTSKQKIIY